MKHQTSTLRWIEIDLRAVAQNVRAVRGILDRRVKMSAVVKADAYGHGAVHVAKAALKSGANDLAVTYLDEALELRQAGIKSDILVMGAVLPEQASLAVKNKLTVMLDNVALLNALAKAGSKKNPARVHVKVNLGLARWGLKLSEVRSFLEKVEKTKSVRLEGVFSHPGYMINKNRARVEEALQEFVAALRPFMDKRKSDLDLHVADTAVLMDFPEYALARVRIGNLIYGINPTQKPLPLKNPWKVFSRIVHIEHLTVGQAVGYGSEFVATQPMVVGTVPVGYAHGLTLEPASRWIQLSSGQTYWGMINGVKCPFVGRVGMSHCLVDLSAVKNPKVGDVIQLPLRRTVSSNWQKFYKS